VVVVVVMEPPPQYNQKLGLYMYRSSIYTSPQFMSCSSSNAQAVRVEKNLLDTIPLTNVFHDDCGWLAGCSPFSYIRPIDVCVQDGLTFIRGDSPVW
jgi:hypothetical protein